MTTKTEAELLDYFISYIRKEGSNRLFKLDVINSNLKTKDTNELYTEVLAKNLIAKNFYNEVWEKEKPIRKYQKRLSKEKTLLTEDRAMTYSEFFTIRERPESEELGYTANLAFELEYDYERPRPHLITYNEKTKTLFYILEEPEKSTNTALNCCLRIRDMMKHIMLEDFEPPIDKSCIDISYSVRPAIFVFEGSTPSNEFKDKSKTQLQKLVKKLGIKVIHTTWN